MVLLAVSNLSEITIFNYSLSLISSYNKSRPIKTFSQSDKSPMIFLTGGGKTFDKVGVAKILSSSAN